MALFRRSVSSAASLPVHNLPNSAQPPHPNLSAEEWATVESKVGTPKYNKAREDFISYRLDRRVKKPVPEAPPPRTAMARRGRYRKRLKQKRVRAPGTALSYGEGRA